MPKLATAMPLLAVVTAVIGAMKPEGRAQIARQHVPVDQQKQCGGHSREEQGGGRVEARQNRHQEGGTEHGDDVLCADTGGAHPSQTFIGSTTSPGASVLPSPCNCHWKILDITTLLALAWGTAFTTSRTTHHSSSRRFCEVSLPGKAICRNTPAGVDRRPAPHPPNRHWRDTGA